MYTILSILIILGSNLSPHVPPEPSSRIFFSDPNPPYVQNTTLRPYQVEGVQWLMERHANGAGGILGDEMGLGILIIKQCCNIPIYFAKIVYFFTKERPYSVVHF
jgi:hypothetical protein